MYRKKLAIWHAAVWLVIISLVIIPMIRFRVYKPIPYVITSFLIYISAFYVNLIFIFPNWARKKKLFSLLWKWLVMIAIYGIVFFPVDYLFGVHQDNAPSPVVGMMIKSLLFTGFFLVFSTAYKFAWDWFHNEQVKRQLENQNLKTELAFLKSQINPHFLFNTLNNIYILAYHQSPRTPDAVMKLSDMMRYLLYESNDESVPLQKEIDHINQMISLQELRMKEPMGLTLSVNGEIDQVAIPPLLLIPFIENIFKHARLTDPDQPVVITITVTGRKLSFYSRNAVSHQLKDGTGGIGLVNVKRRLELIYPDKHKFVTVNEDGVFTVRLTIDLP